MKHRKDSKYGREVMCSGCLLNPQSSKRGFGVPSSNGWQNLNIHGMVACALIDSSSCYPCPVWNRYECPFDNHKKDVEKLFAISEIVSLVIGALASSAAIKDKRFSSLEECKAYGMSEVDEVYNILTDRDKLTQLLEGIDDDDDDETYSIKDIVDLFMSMKDAVRKTFLLTKVGR